MEYLYAQINEDGVCVGTSRLTGEVHQADMVELTEQMYRSITLLGSRWQDGKWAAYEPAQTEQAAGGEAE